MTLEGELISLSRNFLLLIFISCVDKKEKGSETLPCLLPRSKKSIEHIAYLLWRYPSLIYWCTALTRAFPTTNSLTLLHLHLHLHLHPHPVSGKFTPSSLPPYHSPPISYFLFSRLSIRPRHPLPSNQPLNLDYFRLSQIHRWSAQSLICAAASSAAGSSSSDSDTDFNPYQVM